MRVSNFPAVSGAPRGGRCVRLLGVGVIESGFLGVSFGDDESAKHMSVIRRGQSALTAGLFQRLPDEAP